MTGIPQHKDRAVNEALMALLDALCTWERETGRHSILILKEDDYLCRADSGKCVIPDDIPNSQVLGYDLPNDIATLKAQSSHFIRELATRKGDCLNISEKLGIDAITSTLRRMEGK